MSLRKVSIVSAKGTRHIEFLTEATTWGQLKPEIVENNPRVEPDKMKVQVDYTNNTLIEDDALLPVGEFLLFLTIAKSNSGSDTEFSYQECKDIIKEVKSKESLNTFKQFFGNYTHRTTEELNEMVKLYHQSLEKKDKVVESAPEETTEKVTVAIPIAPGVTMMVEQDKIAGIYVPVPTQADIERLKSMVKS